MTAQPLVLAGAGGFARETVGLVSALNAREAIWDLVGFLDDDEQLHGTSVGGVHVIGGIDWARDHDVRVAVCTGSPANYTSRARVVQRLGPEPDRYATLIHPTAVLAPSVSVGAGSVIHALTVATGDAQIGGHVAVMPTAVITHDDVIDHFVTIAAGVLLAGGVHVEVGAYLGSGSRVREQRTIGAWSLVGMGAIVTRDVPPGEVWTGSPAVFLRPASVRLDGLVLPSISSPGAAT
jgi:sugar O-acyltransferase (sialic acid O-acetyltransferase NeuD family)